MKLAQDSILVLALREVDDELVGDVTLDLHRIHSLQEKDLHCNLIAFLLSLHHLPYPIQSWTFSLHYCSQFKVMQLFYFFTRWCKIVWPNLVFGSFETFFFAIIFFWQLITSLKSVFTNSMITIYRGLFFKCCSIKVVISKPLWLKKENFIVSISHKSISSFYFCFFGNIFFIN